jgi:hypothetical protein
MLYFFNRCLHVYPGFSDPPGYRTVNTVKAGVLNQLRKEIQEKFQNLTWKQLVEEGFVIAGSPETVREQMREMITELRIGTVFCLLHMGDMPDWKTRYSSQLFADKVMPDIRDVWAGTEWADDDRWWCHPVTDRVDVTATVANARDRVEKRDG